VWWGLSNKGHSRDEKYVEEDVRYQQSNETATSCHANRDVDRIMPIATGKEEEGVREAKEDEHMFCVIQPSTLHIFTGTEC
jgi:hypothetical protein